MLNAEEDLLDVSAALVQSRREEYVRPAALPDRQAQRRPSRLDLAGADLAADYYEGVRERLFGFDATDDTVWTVTYQP